MQLHEVIRRYRREYMVSLKPNTRRLYETVIQVYIIPALGFREITNITKRDVVNLHIDMATVPYLANRVLAILSGIYTFLGLSSPAKGIRRYNERSRERYLTPEEIKRLSVALGSHKDRPFVHAMLLLLVTGARKREILNAEWANLDWNRKQLKIVDSKGGKKYIILNDFAMAILDSIYTPISPYIIPGPNPQNPRNNIDKVWQRLRPSLSLRDVRIHDLRHTFASITANSPSGNIFVLRDLLHHTSVVTTQRYAHLFDATLRETSNNTGKHLKDLGLEYILRLKPPQT